MLSKSYLKVIAAYIVYESNLSKYAKIQMLRFIENEASESQLKVFINEGKIRKVYEGEVISEVGPIAVAAIIGVAIAAGKAAHAKFFSNAAKACAGKEREEKKKCMQDFKLKANYARMAALKREMGKCSQTDDIKKCRDNFMKHIVRIEKQIRKDRVI